ncbi:MAG TPA: IclR family transcriptional regulator [Chloroflexota bacterium]
MVDESASTNYQVRALTRGLAVLACFTPETSRHSLAELATLVNVPKGTLYRLLETLRAAEFLEQEEDGSYTLGIKAFEVGSAFLSKLDFPQAARRALEELAAECRETASLGVFSHGEVVYVAIEHAQREIGIQSQIGTRHPTHCTALGKVMLADRPDAEVAALLGKTGMPGLTEHTHTSLETLLAELSTVRRRGYAIDNEERSYGVKCIAAPIRDAAGRVIAAISVSGPSFRVSADTLPELIAAVVAAAAAVSRRQGFRQPSQPVEVE